MPKNQLSFDTITDNLLVGRTPRIDDYMLLQTLGVELIINMRAERFAVPRRARRSIRTIWIPTIDHRLFPIHSQHIVRAVEDAADVMSGGGKVYVYCRAGRHRSVMMACAILIAQGYSIESSMALLKNKRLVADPERAHIHKAILEFANYWQSR